MDATQALAQFLSGALSRRRDRYVEFASKPKTQAKLLEALHHELHDCFDSAVVKQSLPERAWSAAAFLYSPEAGFGLSFGSLRLATEHLPDAFLALTQDGVFGVHREEDSIDTQLLISLVRRAA